MYAMQLNNLTLFIAANFTRQRSGYGTIPQ
jgi:hypothetical protein